MEYKDVFYLDDPNISVEFNSDRGSIILTHHNPQKYLFASGKDTMEVVLERYLYNIRKPLVVKTMELWKEHNYKNVELRIEGHTDPNGLYRGTKRGSDESFLQNLDLSSRRANRVYNYILGNKSLTVEQREFAKKNMISVGYSFAHRVQQNNVGDEKLDPSSRRIEFRIISK
ncbi:MAG: OmpA family protein [Prevotella sp.]